MKTCNFLFRSEKMFTKDDLFGIVGDLAGEFSTLKEMCLSYKKTSAPIRAWK